MSLVRAEVARLLTRRSTWALMLVLLVLVAGAGVVAVVEPVPERPDAAAALLYLLVAYLALFGFLLGASSIGSELTNGGIANLLLWRPDRTTVFATKLAVLLGAVLVVGVLATVTYLGLSGLARSGGATGPTLADLAGFSARGVGLAVAAAATGFALAVLGGRTSVALGLVVAHLVGWELGARMVVTALLGGRHQEWFLTTHLATWVHGQSGRPRLADAALLSSLPGSGMVLAALAAVAVGAAAAVFHRRDVV